MYEHFYFTLTLAAHLTIVSAAPRRSIYIAASRIEHGACDLQIVHSAIQSQSKNRLQAGLGGGGSTTDSASIGVYIKQISVCYFYVLK